MILVMKNVAYVVNSCAGAVFILLYHLFIFIRIHYYILGYTILLNYDGGVGYKIAFSLKMQQPENFRLVASADGHSLPYGEMLIYVCRLFGIKSYGARLD